VASFIITAGNYEYAFYWCFYTDGAIELEVRLTGIVLTAALGPGETSDYGSVVAPQTLAAYHQHFLCVRLDMTVDGAGNSVYEVETEPVPVGPGNPYGNAFRTRRTLLQTESQAQRVINPLAARNWLVVNPNVTNALGQPVGYQLVPHGNVLPFAHEEASVIQRAGFITRHLWVTPFAAGERFPAGEYPNQSAGGAGLPEWTKADRPIENTDVVLWYTLGSHHIPRPEDWPVMPVERVSLTLRPFERLPVVGDDRFARHVAAGHDEQSRTRGVAGEPEQQAVHRRVRQHDAEVGAAGRHGPGRARGIRCGSAAAAAAQQYDGSHGSVEQFALLGGDPDQVPDVVDATGHDGERFAAAGLAAAQPGDHLGIGGVAGQVISAEALDREDRAARQQPARLGHRVRRG
jgi:hypothetical protein